MDVDLVSPHALGIRAFNDKGYDLVSQEDRM